MLKTIENSFFKNCILSDLLSTLCFAFVGLVIQVDLVMFSPKGQCFWGLQLFDFQSFQMCLITQKSDIPPVQLGPNKLSSAQVSQAVPPNPSCKTSQADDVRPDVIDVTQEGPGLLTHAVVGVCFSNISSFCAYPEAPSLYFSLILCCFVL